jgi:hypothetical protein
MTRTLSSYIYSGTVTAKVRQEVVKVTIRAVVGEDRHLNIAVPEEVPVGQVLITFTPLHEELDEEDDEDFQLPPGSPTIDQLIDEGRGKR